nr:glycosyltransferase [uncultured Acetatifactor sp.]
MKILQVNCVYGVGSTGKLVSDIHAELIRQGMESVVCYGRGKKIQEPGLYKTCGELYSRVNQVLARARGQLYGGCRISTRRLISVIEKEKPDVVHLQCINGFFVNIARLLEWLKENHVKTVLTLHAEFMFTANCGHARECERWKSGCGKCPQLRTDIRAFGLDGTHASWKKMDRAFRGFAENLRVVSVSPWLMGRARQSPFLADKRHCVVMNGLDVNVFRPREAEELRAQYGPGTKVALFVTTFLTDSPDDLKGGRYVLELARRLEQSDVLILVLGHFDASLSLPSRMRALGRVEDQALLARYYSMADVSILASKRETFSMVTAESLCCGTPVVGFEAGGPESIALPEFSRFVPEGDVEALQEALLHMLDRQIDRERLAREAQELYSGRRMTEEYIRVYRELAGGMQEPGAE